MEGHDKAEKFLEYLHTMGGQPTLDDLVRHIKIKGNKYTPHQGSKEKARRMKQLSK